MRRTNRLVRAGMCVLLLMLAFAPVILLAQQRGGVRRGRATPPAPPARAAAAPIVIVTRTDNSTVRGTIQSSSFDELVVQPALRPGEREPGPPVTLRWGQILRVSNGLTRQKILDEFKAANKDHLCETCHGDRLVFCPTCKGTRHDPASGADCPTCKGELLVDCRTPNCDDGTMPCPNRDCLKLTVGTWATRDDGLKWRTFPNAGRGGGGLNVSERHLGELVVRTGNTWALQGKCPTCGGTTKVLDPVCRATGHIPCATCIARKDVPDCPAGCELGLVACSTCKGSGLKPGAQLSAPGGPADVDPVDAVNPIDQP